MAGGGRNATGPRPALSIEASRGEREPRAERAARQSQRFELTSSDGWGGAVRKADGGARCAAVAEGPTTTELVLGLTPELSRPAKRVRLE